MEIRGCGDQKEHGGEILSDGCLLGRSIRLVDALRCHLSTINSTPRPRPQTESSAIGRAVRPTFVSTSSPESDRMTCSLLY